MCIRDSVLGAHILDLGQLQGAVLLPLGEGGAGEFGVDVDLEGFVVLADDQAVADAVEVGPEGVQIHVRVVLAYNEHRVKGEGDLLVAEMGEVRLLLHRLRLFGAVGNGQTPHLIQHPLADDEKALSAGVHHPGLLQHRVLIDGVGQGHLAGGDGLFQDVYKRQLSSRAKKLCKI